MSSQQSLTSLLADGSDTFGTFFKSGSPLLAEALGHTPLDFLLLDRQHASPSLDTLESVIRAASVNDLPSVVRIPKQEPGLINNVLDMGAQGLMIPQVNDVNEVEAVVNEIRYDRDRSFAMSTRAGWFGHQNREEYIDWVHEEIALLPQIETKPGFENAERIAEHEDVTAIMIGPADLSISLNVEPGSDKLQSKITELFNRLESIECGIGMYAGTGNKISEYSDRTTYLLLGSDLGGLSSWYNDNINK